MKPAGPDNQNLARIYEAAYRPATTTIPHMGTGAEGISDQGSGAPTQSTHTFLTEDTTNHDVIHCFRSLITECTPIIILQIMSFDVVLLSSTYPAVEAK